MDSCGIRVPRPRRCDSTLVSGSEANESSQLRSAILITGERWGRPRCRWGSRYHPRPPLGTRNRRTRFQGSPHNARPASRGEDLEEL